MYILGQTRDTLENRLGVYKLSKEKSSYLIQCC